MFAITKHTHTHTQEEHTQRLKSIASSNKPHIQKRLNPHHIEPNCIEPASGRFSVSSSISELQNGWSKVCMAFRSIFSYTFIFGKMLLLFNNYKNIELDQMLFISREPQNICHLKQGIYLPLRNIKISERV